MLNFIPLSRPCQVTVCEHCIDRGPRCLRPSGQGKTKSEIVASNGDTLFKMETASSVDVRFTYYKLSKHSVRTHTHTHTHTQTNQTNEMYEIRAAHILLRRKLSERKANADKKACKNCIFLLCILPSCPQKIVAGQETQNEKRRWKTKWLLPRATTLSTPMRVRR